jgi:hypothetical protein
MNLSIHIRWILDGKLLSNWSIKVGGAEASDPKENESSETRVRNQRLSELLKFNSSNILFCETQCFQLIFL